MSKKKEMTILSYILLGSLVSLVILYVNMDVYIQSFSANNTLPIIMKFVSFLTITTTILSVIDVKVRKKSKYWYFPIFLLSSLGNLFYSSIQLVITIRNRKDDNNVCCKQGK